MPPIYNKIGIIVTIAPQQLADQKRDGNIPLTFTHIRGEVVILVVNHLSLRSPGIFGLCNEEYLKIFRKAICQSVNNICSFGFYIKLPD